MNPEKKSLIKSIYVYFFTGVGLIMFLVGSFQLVRHVTKKVLLPKYYLEYQETRCDYLSYPQPAVAVDNTKSPTQEDKDRMEKEKQKCEKNLEEERKYQEVLNLSQALSLIILGAGTFVFHYRKTRSV